MSSNSIWLSSGCQLPATQRQNANSASSLFFSVKRAATNFNADLSIYQVRPWPKYRKLWMQHLLAVALLLDRQKLMLRQWHKQRHLNVRLQKIELFCFLALNRGRYIRPLSFCNNDTNARWLSCKTAPYFYIFTIFAIRSCLVYTCKRIFQTSVHKPRNQCKHQQLWVNFLSRGQFYCVDSLKRVSLRALSMRIG